MCKNRASGRELLDDPHGRQPGEQFARASYRTMTRVNRLLGSAQALRTFIAAEAEKLRDSRPLRVLDLGAGDCSLAIETLLWARRRGLKLAFTCVEPNSLALELARIRLENCPKLDIDLRAERIEDHAPDVPYHCALGNLFLHHFSNRAILRLVRRLRSFVSGHVFISDLRRGPVPFIGFALLAAVLPGPVCRDGLLSIRRGFRPGGLKRVIDRVPGVECRTDALSPFSVGARIDLHPRGDSVLSA